MAMGYSSPQFSPMSTKGRPSQSLKGQRQQDSSRKEAEG
jgi:hypothetical protein